MTSEEFETMDGTTKVDLDETKYTYPVYKKHKSSKGSYMYVKFTDIKQAECIAVDNSDAAWKLGYKTSSTVRHDSNAWQDWKGPQPMKTYRIKK